MHTTISAKDFSLYDALNALVHGAPADRVDPDALGLYTRSAARKMSVKAGQGAAPIAPIAPIASISDTSSTAFRYHYRLFCTGTTVMNPKTASCAAFHWPVRVYFEDTDAGGLVYHATYLNYMERTRTEWLRALGFEQDQLREEQGMLFVARRLGIEYRSAARFNDQLSVSAALTGRGRASLDLAQEVLRLDDAVICVRASVNIACVDAASLRPMRIPEAILMAIDSEAVDGL